MRLEPDLEGDYEPDLERADLLVCSSSLQGTLALLLQGYCHQGNMAGATKMLEQMRSLEVPINEHVYAALVTGHSRSGDVKTAGELLGVMRENGLSPGIVAYSALLCAHAERGDIDAIKTVMSEMRENRVFPSVPVYIKMMDALSRSGHGQLVSQVSYLLAHCVPSVILWFSIVPDTGDGEE